MSSKLDHLGRCKRAQRRTKVGTKSRGIMSTMPPHIRKTGHFRNMPIFKLPICVIGYVILMTLNTPAAHVCEEGPCHKGEYWDLSKMACINCPKGFYTSIDKHKLEQCTECENPLEMLGEVVKTNCTPTANTVFGCKDGYCLTQDKRELCKKCANCENCQFQLKECDKSSDVWCCPNGMVAVNTSDGKWKCEKEVPPQEKSCKKGQFWDRDMSCKECPPGHFMDIDNHKCGKCKRCDRPLAKLGEIANAECTPLSNTVIGCAKDHFKTNDKNEMCKKCKVCTDREFPVKPCDEFSDTLCCPKPDMRAVKTDDGELKCSVDDEDKRAEETPEEGLPNIKTSPIEFDQFPDFNDAVYESSLFTETFIATGATIFAIFISGMVLCICLVYEHRDNLH